MRTFAGIESVPAHYGPSAVTIGKFDGVHQGHRAVIAKLREIAESRHLEAVAITFDRHPAAFHAPDRCPPQLVSTRQKLELLATTGLDATVLLHYDGALAANSADAFVRRFLVEALDARVLLVGHDFRYGAGNEGDVAMLRRQGAEHGFEVVVVEDVVPEGGRRVSSTWIRELLEAGDVEHAAELLGHVPTVSGIVVHGFKRGRELGYPTANLALDSEGFIPGDGVYAGWLIDGGVRYPAAISVGDNPTFEGVPKKQVEAYVLDRDLDLYDHVVGVEFAHRIRGMEKFDGIDALIVQMGRDVDRARELIG
ncbi:riboflavin biosynthesis protein [Agromyces luteolus]|uniref:Riboflavin biosynthesis protein n=1 Tax=Agromyces luteolus TaxID=88373 RepID=A0A7C9MGB8_9MICO|nr:bifunctional riboflavin kinase/FAD synthetase [Agromyces luteolus]MUN06538.1 bifunctional riboflavin kinase/FAD synthetase [Agromyces luteolus]GLK29297.1 riboflavin biosynthesis protein [Agromyces luteolus]